jgi:hypothetical protein
MKSHCPQNRAVVCILFEWFRVKRGLPYCGSGIKVSIQYENDCIPVSRTAFPLILMKKK